MTAAAPPRSTLLLGVLAGLALIVLCGLGTWQLQRLNEKSAFLSRLAAQAEAAPAALPPEGRWAALELDSADLTRVRIEGEWLPEARATVRVTMGDAGGGGIAGGARPGGAQSGGTLSGGASSGGFGRYLIQALRLDTGGIVLVNRGFAPEAQVAALPPATGRAALTGILRKPEPANPFTPPANPATRDFFVRDPGAIAAALGLAAAPFMVEAERAPGATGAPLGVDIRELIARVPNNHLQYALTWFGLALTLAGVFVAYLRSQRPARPPS